MTPPWFFAPPEDWSDREIYLSPEETHHAVRVLRIAPPDVVTVTDGRGTVARCAASREEGGRLVAEILERTEQRRVKPDIVVYQGAAKGHKLDEVVEKLAELGAAEVWAFESERSVAHWSEDKKDKLGDRWRSIARSAAKQSRSPFVVQTGAGISWTELLRRVAKEPLSICLWEEASFPMRTSLVGQSDRIAVIVGPEGGFTRDEAEALADAGAQLVSLGPRILRTELAPVVAVSSLLYHFGLIG